MTKDLSAGTLASVAVHLLNPRVARLTPSATVAASERARSLRAQGLDVVDLGGGDPDFPTPDHIRHAAELALARGDTHYVSPAGTPALRQAIARKLLEENGVNVSAAEGVVVTPGGKAALFAAIQALVEPNAEVLLPEPAWVSYRPMVELAGGVVRSVPLSIDDGFRLTAAALEAQVTSATRLLLLCSPCNPTGRVLDAEELETVRAFAQKHDLVVLSDEIYEKIVYDGRRHVSLASLEGMAERTLTFNGFSKAYAMTGWRLGWVAGPPRFIKPIAIVHGHLATCAGSFVQAGGLAALEGSQEPTTQMVLAWERRRRLLCEALAALPGIRCPLPEGAFYALADIRGTPLPSSVDFAAQLLAREHVAVTPGLAFGAPGAGLIRLSFASSDAQLQRGVERIERFVRGLEEAR